MPGQSQKKPRGLSTVALLKVYFDAGQDHIDMFLPFLLDSIRAQQRDDFSLADIKTDLLSRHGLDVPANTLQTLLGRATHRKFLRREAGLYFRDLEKLPAIDVAQKRTEIEREHAAVAKRLCEFAASQGIGLQSEEQALSLILAFLEQNHVGILLAPDFTLRTPDSETLSRRENAMVARFLQEMLRSEPQLAQFLQRMLEGLVLRNALLLSDITAAKRKFGDLQVFFDTRFLFQALALCGEPATVAARETLQVLKLANARLAVFEETIQEIKRVLRVYELHLGTSSGVRTLRESELTRFFLTHQYGPSDVRVATSLLEKNISQLGISIRPFPAHNPKYTLDEKDLARRLAREGTSELEPRVVHDVDCTAAVVTLRAGHTTSSLDNARAIFATTTSLVVKNVAAWYREAGELGVAPVVHILALSNVAWLKKPASAARLKIHELVALCSAALQPTREVWGAFLRHLRALEQLGEVSSDEYVAIVASDLAHSRLVDIEDEMDLDAGTVSEVIERVKATYAAKASRALASEKALTESQKMKAAEAGALAAVQTEEKRQLKLRIRGRAELVGKAVGKAAFCLVTLVVCAGVLLNLPGLFPASPRWARLVGWGIALGLSALSVASLIWGIYVVQHVSRFQTFIANLVLRWLLGEQTTTHAGPPPD